MTQTLDPQGTQCCGTRSCRRPDVPGTRRIELLSNITHRWRSPRSTPPAPVPSHPGSAEPRPDPPRRVAHVAELTKGIRWQRSQRARRRRLVRCRAMCATWVAPDTSDTGPTGKRTSNASSSSSPIAGTVFSRCSSSVIDVSYPWGVPLNPTARRRRPHPPRRTTRARPGRRDGGPAVWRARRR